MRTQDQIVSRFESRKTRDVLGFEVSKFFDFMDFDHAKPYLKDEFTEKETARDEWAETMKPNTKESIKKVMIEYLPFAKGKAENQRGLSAGRSIAHYQAWLWLMDDASRWPDSKIDGLIAYDSYGIPQLRIIAEYLGVNYDSLEN